MLVRDLPTPALLIEKSRLENNLERMQARAGDHDVRLRPHVKTHKSLTLARMQREAGATGITVAKPSEAEVFVNGGFDDVRIAYPAATGQHLERICSLMDLARISFCVDTLEGARAASDHFEERGMAASVLVEVDTGYGRCGIPWDSRSSVEFVRSVTEMAGIQTVGILTHAGNSYAGPANDAETAYESVQRVAAEEQDRMIDFAKNLYEAGLNLPPRDTFDISIGSTPTMSAFSGRQSDGFRVTEIRPGNYVFNDAIQVALGVARTQDCALTVLASVVSRHRDQRSHERVFLDAGRKVFTSDTGYGTRGFGIAVHSPKTMMPLPHTALGKLSEEHGWLTVPGGATVSVGDRVRVIPNHACVTMHTQERVFLVDGEQVIDEIAIDARGAAT